MFYINREPDSVIKLTLRSFDDFDFHEYGHKYLLHGIKLNSVSSIGH